MKLVAKCIVKGFLKEQKYNFEGSLEQCLEFIKEIQRNNEIQSFIKITIK